MADTLISLSCPSCGSKLQLGRDIDRFACAYCGSEQVVKRAGGIVTLSPVVEGLRHVRAGVDRTAAELAVSRLTSERQSLLDRRERLLQDGMADLGTHRSLAASAKGQVLIGLASGAGLITFAVLFAGDSVFLLTCAGVLMIPALALLLIGSLSWLGARDRQAARRQQLLATIAPIDQRLTALQQELEPHLRVIQGGSS